MSPTILPDGAENRPHAAGNPPPGHSPALTQTLLVLRARLDFAEQDLAAARSRAHFANARALRAHRPGRSFPRRDAGRVHTRKEIVVRLRADLARLEERLRWQAEARLPGADVSVFTHRTVTSMVTPKGRELLSRESPTRESLKGAQ